MHLYTFNSVSEEVSAENVTGYLNLLYLYENGK